MSTDRNCNRNAQTIPKPYQSPFECHAQEIDIKSLQRPLRVAVGDATLPRPRKNVIIKALITNIGGPCRVAHNYRFGRFWKCGEQATLDLRRSTSYSLGEGEWAVGRAREGGACRAPRGYCRMSFHGGGPGWDANPARGDYASPRDEIASRTGNRGYGRSPSYDQDTCNFYVKTGTCRHGDRCSRAHPKPVASRAVVVHNLYAGSFSEPHRGGAEPDLNAFYADAFMELSRFGLIDELLVLGNQAHHLVGNVYVRFRDEAGALSAVKGLTGRYYYGQTIRAELMPLARNFGPSCCRAFDEDGRCRHGDACNFFHVLRPSVSLERALFASARPDEAHADAYY